MKTLIVNLFAGPGAGKTAAAWTIAAKLKKQGRNVEYVSEYAKELVWAERFEELRDQWKVAGEQIRRINAIRGKVDIIITDSPILLSIIYDGTKDPKLSQYLIKTFNDCDNFNLFITRGADFEQAGRMQNESESRAIDERIKALLTDNKIFYGVYKRDTEDTIVNNILTTFKRIRGDN